jgi:hypothetical protein
MIPNYKIEMTKKKKGSRAAQMFDHCSVTTRSFKRYISPNKNPQMLESNWLPIVALWVAFDYLRNIDDQQRGPSREVWTEWGPVGFWHLDIVVDGVSYFTTLGYSLIPARRANEYHDVKPYWLLAGAQLPDLRKTCASFLWKPTMYTHTWVPRNFCTAYCFQTQLPNTRLVKLIYEKVRWPTEEALGGLWANDTAVI